MAYEKTEWVRCRKDNLCPVCGRSDYCGVSADGSVAICMRTQSNKPTKNNGWLHRLDEPIPPPTRRKKKKAGPKPDFWKLQQQYYNALTNRARYGARLGVSAKSLEQCELGWDGKAYTFPQRNFRDRIVGIKRRFQSGSKYYLEGSTPGLIIPRGINFDSKKPLFIVEGGSDTAALLTLLFDAIGRPSCSGGVADILGFIKGLNKDIVIMTDKDVWKFRPDGSKFKPGQDGAYRLAKEIKPICKSLKVVRPGKYNDIRQWLNNGATHTAVQRVVDNTRFV